MVGVLNRFEVWAPDAWESFLRESERLLDDVTLGVEWPLPPGPSPGEASAGPSRPALPQPKPKR